MGGDMEQDTGGHGTWDTGSSSGVAGGACGISPLPQNHPGTFFPIFSFFPPRNELLLHLKTYNIYYEGQNLQLRHREEEGELIVEGLLNISWGLRRPIRLQMQDDNQRIRPPPSSSSWHSGCNLGAHGSVLKPSTLPDIQVTDGDSSRGTENPGNGAGGSRGIQGDLRGSRGIQGSGQGSQCRPCPQTSVFTPAYGSVTNVRINSTMTTPQVLKLLLNKFKVAQYIKFEMPILRSFIQKLEEEEDREVKKLKHKYSILRLMIEQRLEEISEGPTAM
ncbi:ras association domain-containing protein 2 [Pyrgilauda ruficollis]|uniref:ras association domain-containing protein 2 n=1 Tax=Pyrgilauda ruficollis TaxID=221976 RepID=UPI001B86CE48|nr:ras association domain-containing protein 2 [Pyrgilauda ruficollis]